jgi:hypothetical protein
VQPSRIATGIDDLPVLREAVVELEIRIWH